MNEDLPFCVFHMGTKKWPLVVLGRCLSYTGTIVWELARADLKCWSVWTSGRLIEVVVDQV